MTDSSNYCSPLLQRLKNIQTNQEQCRLVSNDLLSKLRGSSSTAFQSSISKTSEEVSSNDSVISDISPLVRDRTQKIEENSLNDEKFSWDMLHNAKINSLNSVKENLNCDEKENINSDQEGFSSAPKFSYLKKGKCLSRFKSKSLKGFRKKSNQINVPKTHLEIAKLQSPQVVDNKKEKNNFEKLEQLINNDSFCSTSSKVLELLQDDITSTGCSTPVSTKLSFIATPVFNNKQSLLGTERGYQLVGHASPVRELFPFGKKSSTSNDPQIRIHFQDTGESKGYLNRKNVQGSSFDLRNKYSGILKKGEQNLTTPSPSLLKVQFLEKGVKVLEYDNDESLNLTNCSDDTTDLISVSDLENLALLNFNVNVIHEDSSNVDAFKMQENRVPNIVGAKCEENSNEAIYSGCFVNNLEEVQHESVSKNEILDFKHENRSEDETLDTQMHKMLLLSKVNDLVKEIDIFKNKNKIMEGLISELKNEKQKLVDSQNIPDQNKPKNKFNASTKPKLKSNTAHDKALLNEVSGQIQDLNKKLGSLETENNTLKRKVVSLERREKELRKKQTENGINNKLPSDTESVSSKIRNEKMEIKSKKSMHQIYASAKQPNTVKNKTLGHNSRQYKNEMSSDHLKREMHLFQENKENVLQDTSNILCNNNNKLAIECKEMRYEEIRLNESQNNEVQQNERLNENVISKLQDKATLFTIPEESLSPPFHRNSSVSESSNTEDTLNSLNIMRLEMLEKRSEPIELVSLKPFSVPDDTVEIIDVVGKMSTLSEVEKFEEITNVIQYPNGDKEIIYPSKKVYHYSSNNCVHSLFSDDGREEMQFPNGQKEIYYKDGSYLISFPDQSSKSLTKDGTEISICSDGTKIRVYKSGLKTIHFPNGQKEVHESDCVRRIYPDGTTKILFRDGRQETRYRNGKIRLKDGQGNVTVL